MPWQGGMVLSAFFASYSISQIPGGMLADRFGVRRVATISLLWWSAFTALTGAAANFTHMLLARFIFGLGEGVFPSCVFKTIAVWFPKQERATANAIKMAAGPFGAALAPLFVVGIMSMWGWRHVFYLLFVPGFAIALILWLFIADSPAESKSVDATELSEIDEGESNGGGPIAKTSMGEVMRQPNIVKYFLALFAYDIAYWGFTSWLPTYLVQARGFSMVQMGVAASLPFVAGTVGCILGGWLSDRVLKDSRKLPIIASQLGAALLLFCSYFATSSIVLIACQTMAGFFLNFFFSTFWALPMNSVPRRLMGVASGFINTAGQIAAFISPILIGYLVTIAGGSFGLTFGLLVGSLLASCAIVMTISDSPKSDILIRPRTS